MFPFSRKKKWLIAPLILVVLTGVGFLTMLLWNNLMPVIFHLTTITFWQALGLLILCRLLFGFAPFRRPHHHAHQLRARWEQMNPQEREEFKQRLRRNWCSCENPKNENKNL